MEQSSSLNVVGQGVYLVTVNEEEVKKVICSLRNSKSRDAFHQNTHKKNSATLTPPSAHLVNLSIAHSSFPNDWKHAIGTPIFKSEDHHVVSNYRPISILPVVSKVAMKVVIKQLTDQSCIPGLNPAQFGRSHLEKGGVVGAV